MCGNQIKVAGLRDRALGRSDSQAIGQDDSDEGLHSTFRKDNGQPLCEQYFKTHLDVTFMTKESCENEMGTVL